MTPDEIAALPYRKCVGIMLRQADGRVFVGQRKDRYQEAWQMPQGGVDKGEDPIDAAFRELWEETGVTRDKARLIAATEEWFPYDLPHELVPQLWKGKYKGQEQKWFLFAFEGADADVDIQTEHQEFSAWKWLPADQLLDSIVPFKREVYAQVLTAFEPHL
jgi:putative (di)nucleoside polyphosphate hydrolase